MTAQYSRMIQPSSVWYGRAVWKNVRCAERTSGSIRQDRVELAAAGWLIAWELLIGCGV
jgi:hypothetical protein